MKLVDEFHDWLAVNISERFSRTPAVKLTEEEQCQLDPHLGGIGLAWHLDDFRKGGLSNSGTIRVTLAVKKLLGKPEEKFVSTVWSKRQTKEET